MPAIMLAWLKLYEIKVQCARAAVISSRNRNIRVIDCVNDAAEVKDRLALPLLENDSVSQMDLLFET